jgi:type IV pilus assembly protein PilX
MVLIVSLIMLMLLTLLAITATRTSVLEEMMAGNHKQATQALFAAEEGVSKAIDELMSLTISETDVNWTASGTVTDTDYSAAYSIDHRLVAGAVAATDDGRPYYLIDSTGTSATATRNLEVVLTLEYTSIWDSGITGCDGVDFNSNATTNSYSSSGQPSSEDQGHITSTTAGGDIDFRTDADINGDVRSAGDVRLDSNDLIRGDVLANGGIQLVSNAHVNGDARAAGSITGASGRVDGQVFENVTPNPINMDCDPLGIDDVFTDAGSIQSSHDNGELNTSYFNGTDYRVDGNNTDTLGVAGQAKDYSLTDFTLDSDAVVTIEGDVRLYVSGNFEMFSSASLQLAAGASLIVYAEGAIFTDSNATVNNVGIPVEIPVEIPGGIPANMSFYSNATSSDNGDYKVSLDSNSEFYGTVYAPRAAISMKSNTEVGGAVRGKYVNMDSNPVFSFDEDLNAGSGGPPSDYTLVYWTHNGGHDDDHGGTDDNHGARQ